jgi:hypothetical protein
MLAGLARHVAGVDPSTEMLRLASGRNAAAMTINSMQVCPDAQAGLREIRRVMKVDGRSAGTSGDGHGLACPGHLFPHWRRDGWPGQARP